MKSYPNPLSRSKIISQNLFQIDCIGLYTLCVWMTAVGSFSIYWIMKFLQQAIYIRYVIVTLSKFVQISMQVFLDS